ncbi:RNA-guided endonuclease InsQ/TnpB family protein [Stutzerimonas stutzeri]|uniref:Transposase n=1 Tax=Stutzerimonas stutzeri TaxID=316 RepID=A0AA40RTU5_STUST|nr:RNA-guided endonuclease TnpB family protein [Stutzerimonas stutzeri]MBA1305886.1 transposase [Stutzerimonas stutzeri]
MQRRKVTFKLYPSSSQLQRLDGWVRLHAELYNAALQERIEAYRKAGISISYYDQQNTLPLIKQFRPELVELGSHALQETLRRLDRAFQAFFRRVKAGQSPGFPRFKSSTRFSGFTYPDPAGWKLLQQGPRGGTLRLGSGKDAMMIRLRGRHRFAESTPNDLTLIRRRNHATGQDQWYASVTLRLSESACGRQRTGDDAIGIDLGVAHWANLDDGTQIDNPRWLREALPRLGDLQCQRARKRRGSHRYRQLSQQIARLHQRIGNTRRDFLHKQTSALVQRCALIATEELQPKNMSRSARGTVVSPGRRVRQKAGLNREILSAGLGMAHQMLTYKAHEAGSVLHLSNTRQLKPSQRCSACWAVVPKALSERMHRCACGCVLPRDQNSARVVLLDAWTPKDTPGTGVAARQEPLPAQAGKQPSATRETPTTTATAV